jgi:hypothetical protein
VTARAIVFVMVAAYVGRNVRRQVLQVATTCGTMCPAMSDRS